MDVMAVIPAHNEAGTIAAAVKSVLRQTSGVLVVADNCTDDTAERAAAAGALVLVTKDNTGRKAGALNQALAFVLANWDGPLLVMDADSTISPEFVEVALAVFAEKPLVGAVGGVFYGERPKSVNEQMQATEYVRYSRSLTRTGRVSVLSGTAALFRPEALQSLITSRGFVYDAKARTEDNEVTLALKSLGWQLASPGACWVETELMPTWRDLFRQRKRWYRGAVENLFAYGWTPVTRRYWGQQAGLLLSTGALSAYIVLTIWATALGNLHFSPFWGCVGALFLLERVVTGWEAGWRGRVVTVLVLPELLYDVFLQLTFVAALVSLLFRTKVAWNK